MRSLKGREVVRILEIAGFSVVRTNGSHSIMQRPGHEGTVSVPVHSGKDVRAGTLRAIIKSAGMTVDEFLALDK